MNHHEILFVIRNLFYNIGLPLLYTLIIYGLL